MHSATSIGAGYAASHRPDGTTGKGRRIEAAEAAADKAST
jgi:hypothetical protein